MTYGSLPETHDLDSGEPGAVLDLDNGQPGAVLTSRQDLFQT